MKILIKDKSNPFIAKTPMPEGITKTVCGKQVPVAPGNWLTNGNWAFSMGCLNSRNIDPIVFYPILAANSAIRWDRSPQHYSINPLSLERIIKETKVALYRTHFCLRHKVSLKDRISDIWISEDKTVFTALDNKYSEFLHSGDFKVHGNGLFEILVITQGEENAEKICGLVMPITIDPETVDILIHGYMGLKKEPQ